MLPRRHFFIGVMHYINGEDQSAARTSGFWHSSTPFDAAREFLCHKFCEVIDLYAGLRAEHPWTDNAGRLFAVWSGESSLPNSGRVWVYEQIGGFENTLNDVRDWNPS